MTTEQEIPKKPATEAEAIASLRYALKQQALADTRVAEARDEFRRRERELARANDIVETEKNALIELLNPGSAGRNDG